MKNKGTCLAGPEGVAAKRKMKTAERPGCRAVALVGAMASVAIQYTFK